MSDQPNAPKTNGALAVALIMFAAILVAFAFALIVTNHDESLDGFLSFILQILPITVGVIYVSKQNEGLAKQGTELKRGIDTVNGRVNGALDDQFAALHTKIDGLHERITRYHPNDEG